MFSNNSINTRLFNGYFIIIIFLGIVTIVSLVKLGSINYLKRSIEDNYIQIESISNMKIYIGKLLAETRILTKESKKQKTKDCLNILNNVRNEALKLTGVCVNNPLLLRLGNSINNHCDIVSSKYISRPYRVEEILLPSLNNLGTIISAIEHESYNNVDKLQSSFERVIWSAFSTILFFALITVICSIVLSINIASSITKPLAKLIDVAKKVRKGDLSARVHANTYDEIGTLSTSFNKMVRVLDSDKQKIKEYNRNLEFKNIELKNLSHRLFSVQEDERKHLSQVLHEEIGQSLTALKINFKLLEYYNNSPKSVLDQDTEFQSCVDDSRKIVDMTFKSIKSLAFSLKYNILDTMGIFAATNYYLEQVSKRSPIRIITSSNINEDSISDRVKMYLFRIISEATTNVIKHAKANLIKLDFISERGNIILRIFDNGQGFDVEDVSRKGLDEFKMGITTIKELVNIMKGNLQIISEKSQGTKIIIIVPTNLDLKSY